VETPELMIEINERIRSQLAGTVLPAGATVGAIEESETVPAAAKD
jgi:hypothetical protein